MKKKYFAPALDKVIDIDVPDENNTVEVNVLDKLYKQVENLKVTPRTYDEDYELGTSEHREAYASRQHDHGINQAINEVLELIKQAKE